MYFDLWVISHRIRKCEKNDRINPVFILESCRVKLTVTVLPIFINKFNQTCRHYIEYGTRINKNNSGEVEIFSDGMRFLYGGGIFWEEVVFF